MGNYEGAVNGGGEKCSDAGYVCETERTGFQMDQILHVREEKVKDIYKVFELSRWSFHLKNKDGVYYFFFMCTNGNFFLCMVISKY